MISFRKAKPSDIDAIHAIELQSFSTPWSKEALLSDLEGDDKIYLIGEDERGHIIGYGGAWLVLDEGQITNIAIHDTYRRKGYGTQLTDHLVKELGKLGMTQVYLEVRLSNIGAQRMYEGLGFSQVGLRKRFYTNPVEDAMIMVKHIDNEGITI